MRITIKYNDCDKIKKINFQMADEFSKVVIKKNANKVIRERWPELVGKIEKMEWKF